MKSALHTLGFALGKGIFVFLVMLNSYTSTLAVDVPAFPSCPHPGGEVIASYAHGTHGVPGDATTYIGEDVVYRLNENQVAQCLCTVDGKGVQTWWWRQPALTIQQEDLLNKQGWIRVASGAPWGLDAVVYYAKNTYYDCGGGVGGYSAGRVLGVSTLASTGTRTQIILTLAIASSLALSAVVMWRQIRR